jgi:hypothetical protein
MLKNQQASKRGGMRCGCIVIMLMVSACERTRDSSQVQAQDSGDLTPASMQTREADGVDSSARELRAALAQLVSGQSMPADSGTHTWFSPATAEVLRSVSVDSTGHATVDFNDLRPSIQNASSSAGSTLLLSELNSTVFGVEGIRSVEYRMDGSCALFWEWLQYGCQVVTRAEWARVEKNGQ